MCGSFGDQREAHKHVGQSGGKTSDAADIGSSLAEWWRSLEPTSPEQHAVLCGGGNYNFVFYLDNNYVGGCCLHPCDCHRGPAEDHARDALED